MVDILIDLYQQGRIQQAATAAGQAMTLAERNETYLTSLQHKYDKLTLVSQVLMELVQSRLSISDSEILAKLEEIDMRDGTCDGRIGQQAVVCDNCKRRSNSRRTNCIYCGYDLPKQHICE